MFVVWLWFKQSEKNRLQLAVAVAIAGIVSLMLVKLAGGLYSNPRPFIVEHIKPLVEHGNDNGFPSEHTVFAATLTAVIYFYNRKKYWKLALIALAVTLLVGTGRVLAHVHHPIDIMVGLEIGVLAGFLGHYIAKKLLAKSGTEPKPTDSTPTANSL